MKTFILATSATAAIIGYIVFWLWIATVIVDKTGSELLALFVFLTATISWLAYGLGQDTSVTPL